MTRIAVGGFLHETNTFAPTKATYDAFVHGGGWPAMSQGDKLIEKMRGINIGMAGFVPAAEAEGGAGADHLVRRKPIGPRHRGCV